MSRGTTDTEQITTHDGWPRHPQGTAIGAYVSGCLARGGVPSPIRGLAGKVGGCLGVCSARSSWLVLATALCRRILADDEFWLFLERRPPPPPTDGRLLLARGCEDTAYAMPPRPSAPAVSLPLPRGGKVVKVLYPTALSEVC